MPESLAAALAELQANPPRIRKRARAQYGNYADLPAVHKALMPRLSELGLLWQTWPDISLLLREVTSSVFVLRWKLTHIESGEWLEGQYPIHATDPQRQGSEITYARRYALVTVTGVTPEGDDDDGQAASRQRTPAKIPGPDHERLQPRAEPGDRPAERVRPGDNPPVDMWMSVGTFETDEDPPEDRPGSIDPKGTDMKRIQSLFSKLGIDDRSVRLGMTSDLIGREILSATQLSVAEGKFLIRKLNERLEATP